MPLPHSPPIPPIPQIPAWSAARDEQLRGLRREGATWARIAVTLGVSPDAARERGRRIGAPRPPQGAVAAHAHATPAARDDPARPPLPPGHPRAWGLLIQGTLLAGTDWPGWEQSGWEQSGWEQSGWEQPGWEKAA